MGYNSMLEKEVVIRVRGLKNYLGKAWVHQDVNFDIYRGEVVAIIGASGCGKTTLLRSLLLLQEPAAGEIMLFGENLLTARGQQKSRLRRRWGMMFQSSALFSSMDVLENVMFPMDENLSLTRLKKQELAQLKLRMCGLSVEVGSQFPSELSGGMQKRAALARAIALDPELLFLDEPSAGLDPESAASLDSHLMHLRDTMGLTQVMVTHDLDTLWSVPDRVMFLGEGKVLALCSMHELVKHQHPMIQAYFSNIRSSRFIEET
jgi:phospholipid/cholesterol/gamma-HCH transport system ATP-binding protein